jgi:hypothetical protein
MLWDSAAIEEIKAKLKLLLGENVTLNKRQSTLDLSIVDPSKFSEAFEQKRRN